jgi:ribonucleoside-diphosphate reductase alpha chain
MAKSLVDYVFRYMASKFMSQDEKDQVGIINRQLTLSDAPVAGGELAAPDATSTAASAAATSPASASGTTDSTESSNADAAASGSAASETQAAAIPVDADAPAAEPETPSLLDGLKVLAKADASREERLNVGQAPVIFDTADSPACTECGSIMVRNGSCYKCINCGATSGCS